MKTPENLLYTDSHEWVLDNKDGTITVGITDHAQELLGDMVFVQLPTVGQTYNKGGDCGVVESVKSASDVYAPVTGEVIAINDSLTSAPEQINQDAYNAWIWKVKVSQPQELSELLSAQDYQKVASDH